MLDSARTASRELFLVDFRSARQLSRSPWEQYGREGVGSRSVVGNKQCQLPDPELVGVKDTFTQQDCTFESRMVRRRKRTKKKEDPHGWVEGKGGWDMLCIYASSQVLSQGGIAH